MGDRFRGSEKTRDRTLNFPESMRSTVGGGGGGGGRERYWREKKRDSNDSTLGEQNHELSC